MNIRKLSYVVVLALCLLLPHVAECGSCSYHNERYGFGFEWVDGRYTSVESQNGDGVTITDGKGLELRAWGTMSPSVFGDDFAATMRSARGMLDAIDNEQANKDAGEFILQGRKDSSFVYVKVYYTPDVACYLLMRCPLGTEQTYRPVFDAAAYSFKFPMDGPAGADFIVDWPKALKVSDVHLEKPGAKCFQYQDSPTGSIFVVHAETASELTVNEVSGVREDGSLVPGRSLARHSMRKGDALYFLYMVPEGMPRLMLCSRGRCWSPLISGKDGSLLMAPGFVWRKEKQ